jgi:hypothetical protein
VSLGWALFGCRTLRELSKPRLDRGQASLARHVVMVEVPSSASAKGLKLGCDEVRGINNADAILRARAYRVPRCRGASRGVPAIREAEDALVVGHDVYRDAVDQPPTKGCAGTPICFEAKSLKPRRQRVVLRELRSSDPAPKLLHTELTFARSASTHGVDQRQELIQLRISSCRFRDRTIQRLDLLAADAFSLTA